MRLGGLVTRFRNLSPEKQREVEIFLPGKKRRRVSHRTERTVYINHL